MSQNEQLVFAFAPDYGMETDMPLSMRLHLGRLKFMEELSAQQEATNLAWRRVERAVSAFGQIPPVAGA